MKHLTIKTLLTIFFILALSGSEYLIVYPIALLCFGIAYKLDTNKRYFL